jgi:hypothetical protein
MARRRDTHEKVKQIEATKFADLAAKLQVALDGSSAESAVALHDYFQFLSEKRLLDTLANNSGLQAEMRTVIQRTFPFQPGKPAPKRLKLRDAAIDMTALFAKRHLPLEATEYARSWKAWRSGGTPNFNEAEWVFEKDAALLLDPKAELPHPVAGGLLAFLARWLKDNYDEDALRDELKAVPREERLSPASVLRFQLFALGGTDPAMLEDPNTQPRNTLAAALRFWADHDPFCRYLFKERLEWLKPIDFNQALTPAEERSLADEGPTHSSLYRYWTGPDGSLRLASLDLVSGSAPPGSGFPIPSRPPLPRPATSTAPTEEAAALAPVTPPVPEAAPPESGGAPKPPAPASALLPDLDAQYRFRPIPCMMVGPKSIGKTSFLGALMARLQHQFSKPAEPDGRRRGIELDPQAALLTFWEGYRNTWLARGLSNTATISDFELKVARNTIDRCDMYLRTIDYPGEYLQPNLLPPSLQDEIAAARGFFFFFDATDLTGEPDRDGKGRLFATVTWYTALMKFWDDRNPLAKHVPVAVVVNKCDEVLNGDLAGGARSHLISARQRALIHGGDLSARAGRAPPPRAPLDRLRICVTEDLDNSTSVGRKALVWDLLDRLGKFLTVVLRCTYRYQVFLTASVPPRAPTGARPVLADDTLPFGVFDAVNWLAGELHAPFTGQAARALKAKYDELDGAWKSYSRTWDCLKTARDELEVARANLRIRATDPPDAGPGDDTPEALKELEAQVAKLTRELIEALQVKVPPGAAPPPDQWMARVAGELRARAADLRDWAGELRGEVAASSGEAP